MGNGSHAKGNASPTEPSSGGGLPAPAPAAPPAGQTSRIGRPTPGSSSAARLEEQQPRAIKPQVPSNVRDNSPGCSGEPRPNGSHRD